MATMWIIVLAIGVLTLETSSFKLYSYTCPEVNKLYKFPNDCHKYLSCAPMGLVEMDCPANLFFDVYLQRCEYNVPGCDDSVPIGPCTPNHCVYGTCVQSSNTTKGYECVCQKGITGPSCLVDIDECSTTPCVRGICTNTFGGFSCDCGQTGYTGTYCEIPPPNDPCISGRPCVNGRCQHGPNSNYCICSAGYAGDLCDSDVTGQCSSFPCSNGGKCVLTPGGYYCNCTGTGYSGDTCGTRDYCSGDLCKHGRCSSTSSGFNCDCRGTGFEGVFCQIPLQGNCSTNNPCVRGTCLSLASGPFCDCQGTGYTGRTCEIPGVGCFVGACTNGVCVTKSDTYTCDCTGTVYTGPRCDMTACDFSGKNPCLNGGTCIPGANVSYTCVCPSGLTGAMCETLIPVSGCPAYPCPTNVPRFNYANWEDRTCVSYYNCDRGTLLQRSCPAGQKFDVLSMMCKSETDKIAVFCSAFFM